jgi:hypothetical protein
MVKKPDLSVFTNKPLVSIPRESFDEFKHLVRVAGMKPSIALRQIMKKYNCSQPGASLAISMVEVAYPEIDITRRGFRFRINDSDYPNSDPKQFSDDDFDKGIEEILALPNGGW